MRYANSLLKCGSTGVSPSRIKKAIHHQCLDFRLFQRSEKYKLFQRIIARLRIQILQWHASMLFGREFLAFVEK